MKRIIIIICMLVLVFFLGGYISNKNNPYAKNTWVTTFFTTRLDKDGQIELKQTRPIQFIDTPFGKAIFYIQAFFRIEGNAHFSEKPFTGDENAIISQIHTERFDVTKPYVISGGHFAEFYVRNFGIFNSAMMDQRFALSKEDWLLRQRVTLQTISTHLELLRQSGKEYTTFVPISSTMFVGANFETQPSDSLFAVYYTLSGLTNPNFINQNFPATSSATYSLQTQNAGNALLQKYSPVLSSATSGYLANIIDPKTGLIKKDITLSSARDGIKRQSSFYDNVIAWSTAKMASDLGVAVTCPDVISKKFTSEKSQGDFSVSPRDDMGCNFPLWKQKIISAFWDDKTGIFIDDLSEDSITNHIFSGDSFIVTSTRFLDVSNAEDKKKLEREIDYVQKNNLANPFPLFYAEKNQPNKLYFLVRYFAPSYMGESIWSHWGIEYIKSLLLLSKDNPEYLSIAEKDLQAYKTNIEKYGGYPELYNKDGTIFTTPFYKSVLHTSWVVNYEQAKMMLDFYKRNL